MIRGHVLVGVAALSSVAPLAEAADRPVIRWEPYELRAYDGRSLQAGLGRIIVPQRHDSNAGRTMELAFLKLPTTSSKPGHPIVFLMGGPGVPGSAMAPIPPYFDLFEQLRSLSDVILLDQRGLGLSRPVLECPSNSALPADLFTGRQSLVQAMASRVATCARHWRAEGFDPCAFNTIESADDVEDLRRALEVEKLSLLAFSYGTRLALAALVRHPGGIGRVVLAGVDTPDHPGKEADAIERKLALLGHVLERDTSWHATTDLIGAARTIKKRLQAEPAVIQVADQRNQRLTTVAVDWEGFGSLVALHLDDARLPALLAATASGDDSVLIRLAEGDYNGLGNSPTGLMARVVSCASGVGRRASAADSSGLFGDPIDNEFLSQSFCDSIGCSDARTEFPRAVRSKVPALFITGSLDCTTPLSGAVEVRSGFSTSASVEVENAGHETLTIPAVQEAVATFLRSGSATSSHLTTAPPRFVPVAEAKRPGGQRRR